MRRPFGDHLLEKETPSILVTLHGPLVSKPLNATQIYAQKCTTKPIALKPAIEFCSPNTADEEALCHSRCFTTKKEKLRTHP